VVTGSLLQSGSLQVRLGGLQSRLVDPAVTAMVSFWASQPFSNVPVVDIYLKLLQQGEIPNLIMLAGMSTLAGNLFIISAASNVIVVQQAEKLGRVPFTFWRFTFAVLPITIVSAALAYGWIAWMGAGSQRRGTEASVMDAVLRSHLGRPSSAKGAPVPHTQGRSAWLFFS
jgi:Na+/H+ antiporter NhaD/arsenite permease-like protein